MLVEHLLHGLGEIAQEMPAVGDLRGGGGSLPRPVGVGGRAITCNHLDPRMGLKPLRQGVSGAIREQRHRLPALQVDQHRANRDGQERRGGVKMPCVQVEQGRIR
jgi:hypothetical protein